MNSSLNKPAPPRPAGRDRNIVIAIDGPSASGKSTCARRVAQALGYSYVDTGAMYRTLAWHCLRTGVNVHQAKEVAGVCQRWKTTLECINGAVRLLVGGYYPQKEIRTAETSEAVSHVAAIPKVREWMKHKQRECIRFGNIVMEGRDIGTNVFPETEFKFFLDANPEERARRRAAQGVRENLAARDHRDSQRASAPLMVGLGAFILDNSGMSNEQTSDIVLAEFKKMLAARADREGNS